MERIEAQTLGLLAGDRLGREIPNATVSPGTQLGEAELAHNRVTPRDRDRREGA